MPTPIRHLPPPDVTGPPGHDDILFMTCVVVSLAGNGPEDSYVALAQMIRNRRDHALAHVSKGNPAHPLFGDGSWQLSCPPGHAVGVPSQLTRAHFRAMASICRVFAGEEKDLVDGATTCHLHSETPSWSAQMIPTALIGDHFFCREQGSSI